MDNYTIARILGESGCRDRFRVLAADELPTGKEKDFRPGDIIIANTDNAGQRGTHWVLFFLTNRYILNYFDPLGDCSLEHGTFRQFANRYATILVTNRNYPVQFNVYTTGVYSDSCAIHCLYMAVRFCKYRHRHGDHRLPTLTELMQKAYRKCQLGSDNDELTITNRNECIARNYLLKRFIKHSKSIKKLVGCY